MDESKWSFTDYMNGYSDLSTLTTSDVAAVTTDVDGNGVLRLAAKKIGSRYKTCKSVTTGERMTFVYGYLEMRAKVPIGLGVWPSLWLKSDTTAGGGALAESLGYRNDSLYETEVDVFEVFGGNYVQPNLHKWWKTQEQIDRFGVRVSSPENATRVISDGGWHTYGMLWTPYEISMYLDGVCYQTYDLNRNICSAATSGIGMEGFHNPLCIILNNHLFTPALTSSSGGAWAKSYTVPSDFTSAIYDIDYIRLYQKPGVSELYFAE